MINKKTSYKSKFNKIMSYKRLSKKNIRKSKNKNLIGGLNCGAVLDEETCRARLPECLWKPRGRRCVDNPDAEVRARFDVVANPVVNPVVAAARARIDATRAAAAAANPVVAARVAARVAAAEANPVFAARVAARVAAVRAAAINPVEVGPNAPVIYTQADRNAAVVAFVNTAVVFPPIPVVPIVYNVVRIPEVDEYNAEQEMIMFRAIILSTQARNREEYEDAHDLYNEAERRRFGIDEPVRYNIIDNILDAGGIPPQNIDPNLLRVFGDFVTFDMFEQENVTIRDHLMANPDNITIFYRQHIHQEFNSIVLTFTQLKTYLKESTNLFYQCNVVGTWHSYRLRPPQYLKLPVNDMTIYVSYSEIRQKCINGQRMIFLEFNRQIDTTISFHVSVSAFLIMTTGEHIPAAVSANHCQDGSSIQLYNIIA